MSTIPSPEATPMHRLSFSLLVAASLVSTAAEPAVAPKTGLQPGANLPGTLAAFNVTGPAKGRFHCLISDYGLGPVVMIVVRDLEVSESLKELLQQVDERIEKNPDVRLRAFAVFASDDLPDAIGNNEKRDELARKIDDIANELKLKNVILCLDTPTSVAKFSLPDAWATVILYRKFRIEAVQALPKGDAKELVAKLLVQLGEKLGATKTK